MLIPDIHVTPLLKILATGRILLQTHRLNIYMGLAQSHPHNLVEFGYSIMQKAAALPILHCVAHTIFVKIYLLSHWQREVVYHTRKSKQLMKVLVMHPDMFLSKNIYCRETSSKPKDCPTPELKGFSSLDGSLHLHFWEALTEVWGSNVQLWFLPYKVSAIS